MFLVCLRWLENLFSFQSQSFASLDKLFDFLLFLPNLQIIEPFAYLRAKHLHYPGAHAMAGLFSFLFQWPWAWFSVTFVVLFCLSGSTPCINLHIILFKKVLSKNDLPYIHGTGNLKMHYKFRTETGLSYRNLKPIVKSAFWILT